MNGVKIKVGSIMEFLTQFARTCDEMLLVSPWVSKIVFKKLEKWATTTDIELLTMEKLCPCRNIRLFRGPFHAKLYIFKRLGKPLWTVFGSQNLTTSNLKELVLVSSDLNLNVKLESFYHSLKSHGWRVSI